MNYQAHYDRLIERARNRVLEGYAEKHHVIPRCLGGGDEKTNLVRLTPEEHYVAHQLLVCIHPGHYGLLYATIRMCSPTDKRPIQCNKLYGWIRKEFAIALGNQRRGQKASPETRARQSASRLGTHWGSHTAETKLKMSRASKGRPKSEAHKKALSIAKKGIIPKRGEAWKRNQAAAMRRLAKDPTWLRHQAEGRVNAKINRDWMKSEEYRRKQSANMKIIWAKRKTETT